MPVDGERVRVVGRHDDQRLLGADRVKDGPDGFLQLDRLLQRSFDLLVVMRMVEGAALDDEQETRLALKRLHT